MESTELPCKIDIDGVTHEPVVDEERHGLLGKALTHRRRMSAVIAIVDRMNFDFAICRGAPAGAFGSGLYKKFGIPFCVESFEPHAEYMRSTGIWSKYDPRYLVQRRWEEESKRLADKLITVSESYAKYLVDEENLPSKDVLTVPCWVDETKFSFSAERRKSVRRELGLDDAIVCVYVGKFGGIYYERAAMDALKLISDQVGKRFFVLILSPDSEQKIARSLKSIGFDRTRFWVGAVSHEEVPGYLSGSDFAISFHKSTNWSFAFSPIKHAEYWACGLPTLIPKGVGDEARWIEGEGLGYAVNIGDKESLRSATKAVIKMLVDKGHRERIRNSALQLRGRTCLDASYDLIVSEQLAKRSAAGS